MNEISPEVYRTIGLNISLYRRLRGYTQAQLAERIHISRTHLSNIEAPNVPTSISLKLLLTIAKNLEIPPEKLLAMPLDET